MATRKWTLFTLAPVILAAYSSPLSAEAAAALEGVWRVAEVTFIRPDGNVLVPDPQPGLFIFTKSHYSSTWVPTGGPRKSFVNRFEPTRDELAEACNSLVVNSGIYETSGAELTVRPVVTRVPEFSGGRMIYRYAVEGDVLSLEVLDEYSRDGVQAPWIKRQRLALKLLREE